MYSLGVAMAVLSGIAHNVGLVIQKKEINRIVREGQEGRFFSNLFRNPLWLTGFIINFGLGTVFFLLAQRYLGPALIPGLMAVGLIVLVIGSIWILGESLVFADVLAIVLLILAIALLGLSRLTIDVGRFDVLELGFLVRAGIFTGICLAVFLPLQVAARRSRARGIFLAVTAGLLYTLSNFWVGPFMGTVLRIFAGRLTLPVIALFVGCAAILVATNVFGIGKMQLSFRVIDASLAIPIQQVPVQIAPAFVYLAVFRLPPLSRVSVVMFCASIGLIITSTFLLSGRQSRLQGIGAREPG